MLQIFRGKVCKGEGLQYNTGTSIRYKRTVPNREEEEDIVTDITSFVKRLANLILFSKFGGISLQECVSTSLIPRLS